MEGARTQESSLMKMLMLLSNTLMVDVLILRLVNVIMCGLGNVWNDFRLHSMMDWS